MAVSPINHPRYCYFSDPRTLYWYQTLFDYEGFPGKVLHGTAQYCPVLQGTAGYYTVLQGTRQCLYASTQCHVVLHGTTRYYTVLHGTTRHYTVLHGTTRYNTVLYDTSRRVHGTTGFENEESETGAVAVVEEGEVEDE
eukprot:2010556-Rhodomonas_salina.4